MRSDDEKLAEMLEGPVVARNGDTIDAMRVAERELSVCV